ncbi:CRE-NPP-5 protein [Caenorhabditis remanei]|uniref:Nuclear pore complex protein n=1 Tax=Caenorhabditis remanei TaxID=31234 RepID=E3LF52_CAERE|nr:CRE-NPP-5 protein [Caenorhabditis remanei]
MSDLFASGDQSSGSLDGINDDIARKNEAAFKYTSIFHTNLCEKLYQELGSLAVGQFDIPGGQISPLMWTRLHEIYSELEAQTRKLPTGAKYSVASQKYANEAVQIASVLSIYTALAHEYDETLEVSLLSKLVVDDVEFRRVYALLLWSEKAISEKQYEPEFRAKFKKLDEAKSIRLSSMMSLKRPTFSTGAPKDASLDPDAPGTKEEQALEQLAFNMFFELVRGGETAKAAELATTLGMSAIGAQLQLHSMLRNPLDVPLEATTKNFGEHKRTRRAKYYEMIQKQIEQSKGKEDDAYWTLISAIRGNISPMLKAGKTVIEKVWAYANSAFLARILAAEGAMSQEKISTLFNVPLTAKSILEELRSQYDGSNEVYILLRVIDDMLNDDIEDLYKFANDTVGEYVPNDKHCEVNVLALDIFFHLVAVSYASGFEPNDDGNAVIVLGFDDLRARSGNTSHKRMAAFYSRFLPEDMKLPEIVETMKMVESEKEREIFVDSLRQSEIDFGRCACTLIEQIRKEDASKVITLEKQIDHWNWLLVGGEETALAALEECNRLIRKVMRKTPLNEALVRQIIRKALQFELPKLLSLAVENETTVLSLVQDGTLYEQDKGSQIATDKIEHAAFEFYGLCSIIDVNNFVITIALKLGILLQYTPITEEELNIMGGVKRMDNTTSLDWEASLRVRARAEQTLRDDVFRKTAADLNTRLGMIQQHFDTVLPMFRGLVNNIGIRGEYFLSPRINGDPMCAHRKEIQQIRNIFLTKFFITIADAAAKLKQSTRFHEVVTSFNDDFALDHENVMKIKETFARINIKVE